MNLIGSKGRFLKGSTRTIILTRMLIWKVKLWCIKFVSSTLKAVIYSPLFETHALKHTPFSSFSHSCLFKRLTLPSLCLPISKLEVCNILTLHRFCNLTQRFFIHLPSLVSHFVIPRKLFHCRLVKILQRELFF